ncbi:LIM/homeobox protein Lhx9 [Cryptotermes secundus]|uniref:LIM/homeobox protein Lhx9 n=1 Tax=Cryptotermes secundus TaxID=105785 RepID=UPI000CD7D3D3|nr:LIM/homeobox protein Lhx9 [Cryptotermes secundus]
MNPHYHPYTELNSPHSPPPDNNNYHGHPQHGHPPHPHHPGSQSHGSTMSNGHVMGPNHHHHHHPQGSTGPPPHPGPHHDHHQHPHHQHPPFGSGGPPPGAPMHHPHHHHINNNNNNNNNNSNNNNCPTVKVCAGCGGKIVERFLLHALDRYWHNGCLKCTCCGAMLADIGGSCFTKANMILCKNDYYRMFGISGACSACGQTIPASEFVMRAGSGTGQAAAHGGGPQQQPGGHQVFHLKCFTCSKCGAQLVPGDRYYLLAGSLICEQDWHKLLKGSGVAGGTATNTGTGVRKGKVGRPRRSRD